MDSRRSQPPLLRYFSGLAEQTFQAHLGVADPPLVDYLANLLARFIHSDAVYGMRNLTGQRLGEVAEMLLEAEERLGDARRQVHRHIGDFTLFWTGVYPEAVEKLQQRSRLDRYLNYHEQGKRAYYIASTIPADNADTENAVLERLSQEFDLCAYGLSEVRREWERQDPERQRGLLLD